ncbi:axoneme-associated protein mst101(1)-like [Eriocheir sinensis]|uniref:axoneme-associated protein mst101(1)-like n=1 Tax=Eriocheir sinensis TaxID=95602 RepID=UPI0021C72299|nr:axoneme-associated protein mst101(1)-like [Eriocheir sinensis]
MFSSDCAKCQKEVTAWSKGVSCERCDDWYHVGCMVVKGAVKPEHMKILKCKNIWFVCETCQERTRREWKEKDKKTRKEEEAADAKRHPPGDEVEKAEPVVAADHNYHKGTAASEDPGKMEEGAEAGEKKEAAPGTENKRKPAEVKEKEAEPGTESKRESEAVKEKEAEPGTESKRESEAAVKEKEAAPGTESEKEAEAAVKEKEAAPGTESEKEAEAAVKVKEKEAAPGTESEKEAEAAVKVKEKEAAPGTESEKEAEAAGKIRKLHNAEKKVV